MWSDFSLNTVLQNAYAFSLIIYLTTIITVTGIFYILQMLLLKKNLNASKPSEHPPQVEECLKV